MLLSIVIPVYNSGTMLPLISNELMDILSNNNISHEIIMVNDSSTDDTWKVIEDLMARHHCIKGINLTENVGQFMATLIGTKVAIGNFILHMDDDLEHPPSEVIKLWNEISQNEQWQIVFGMSKYKYQIKGSKCLPILRNNIINFLWGKYSTDSFRIFRREIVFNSNNFIVTYPMFEVYLKHHVDRSKVGYIQVERNPRLLGQSGYPFYKKVKLFFKLTPSFLFKNYNRVNI